MDRRRLTGIGLILASAAGFGSGPLFAQPVYAAGVDWLVLLAWRFLFGATLIWAWLLISAQRRAGLRSLDRRMILATVALGTMYIGNSGSYYAGLQTVSPSLAALIVYVYPVLVAVLTLRFGRRLEGRRPWLALAIALVGVALSLGGIDATSAPPLDGLLLVIASPVIYAFWIILSARLAGERRETIADEGDGGAAATAATALMMSTTAAIYWGLSLANGRPVLPWQVPGEAWPGLLGVGVFATFIAVLGFYAGTQRIGAAQAALVSTIEPLWTIVLAAILFSFTLTPLQIVGGALILGGVVIAQTAPGQARTPNVVRVPDE